jgi:hypothetical protein
MAQHHFVVIYDDVARTWQFSSEDTVYAYPEGEVYDTPSQRWLCVDGENTLQSVSDTYNEGAHLLKAMLAGADYTRGMLQALDLKGGAA